MPALRNHSYPIGLDISDLSVKLIQLKKAGADLKIQAMGKVNLPEGVLENGEIKNRKELIKAIKHLLKRPGLGKITTTEAVVCLPEGKTFLKVIEIPKDTENFKEALEDELQKHIPLPLEEIYYDWQQIGDSGKTFLILAGAAAKKNVEEQLELLEELKLSVVAIEAEPLSVCRSLLEEEKPGAKSGETNYAIIDIGATDASLTVYSKNTILFSVSMPISGEKITEEISTSLGISREQGEKLKIIHGLGEEEIQPAAKKILLKMICDLAAKTKEAIAFFNHHFHNWGPIEKIILCGGGANIKDLDKIIQKETEIATAKGDVLINLKGNKSNLNGHFKETFGLNSEHLASDEKKEKEEESKTIKFSQNAGLSYTTAIGLALRGVFIEE